MWTALLWRHHSRILRLLFHGQPPRENDGLSPKQAYFEFARSWKLLAQRRSGRLLLKIDGEAAGGLAGTFGVYDATEYAPQHPGFELIVEDACGSFAPLAPSLLALGKGRRWRGRRS